MHSFIMRRFDRCIVAVFLVLAGGTGASAQENATSGKSVNKPMDEVVAKGLDYLQKAQGEDGTLSPRIGSGVTSLAVTAALRNGRPLDDPLVARGLKALEEFVKPDGGIYGTDRLRNYETCVAIVALADANRIAGDGRYDKILKDADKFVRGLQYGAAGNVDASDQKFGGVGYSGPERPDLSNTAYLIEALHALGADGDDPAIQRALVFVGRCQNLEGKWNDTEFGDKVNDGGFYYVIPTEKVDPSETDRATPNGGLRSYGSMTYAGFKSLVYAGLTKDDPRTQAALKWIGDNYSVTENPGQGTAGLFYYYHLFGSALAASELQQVADHDWRKDLVTQLTKEQRPDGSWTNDNRQWMENDPNLCTAFALLALSYCDEDAGGK
jgi:hypothetical protein